MSVPMARFKTRVQTSTAKPYAYSYVRFSTPEQARGESFRRQIEAARAYAAKNGLVLDESFRDEGVSAFKGKHRDERVGLPRFCGRLWGLADQGPGCGFWAMLLFVDEG